jgi:hypothetical protein
VQKDYDRLFVLEELIATHQRKLSQLDVLNMQPLYPTEELLWDVHQIPNDNFAGACVRFVVVVVVVVVVCLFVCFCFALLWFGLFYF